MLGTRLKNYEIKEKLGAGGQGTVYLAEDVNLGRKVVIKVLPPELTVKTANLHRFEREAKLCSQLDHPNICTIFDFGEANGVYYIAMQYVKGKNVRQLVNGKPLELRSALSIANQVCDALTCAHELKIIHRDIKAGNVMVTDTGQVKILDFGLAKLVEDENSYTSKRLGQVDLTEIGIPYGTATYAAPEQARGDRVDHRADIFSTGVLMYEMLVGIWPFQGKTVIDVRHAVLHSQPKPLAEARPEPVPPRLQEILDRAMAKEPRDRYQKMSEMREDVRQVLQEVSGYGVLPGETFVPRHTDSGSGNVVSRALNWLRGKSSVDTSTPRTSTAGTSFHPSQASQAPQTDFRDITATSIGDREKKSVAILPFKNLNGDAESKFLEFALADSVITELARLRSLIVRPSSAIDKFKGTEIDPQEAGSELQVNAVLSAGFLKAGDKMRVTAQLLDVATGDLLWSERIDANANDIFAVQDEIAKQVVTGLKLELTSHEQEKLGQRHTENAEAYEEYLRGRDNFGRFIFRTLAPADADAAIANFKHAIELDPKYALAYSGLGAVYANRVFKGIGDTEDYNRAEAAFSHAIQIDPNVVEARVLMMFIYMSRGEKKKARIEIARLQDQFPNDAALHFAKANLHRLDGDYDRALRSWDRLERLDPAARVIATYNRARIYTYQGDVEKGLQEIARAEAAEPNHPLVKIFHARILLYHNETNKAIRLMQDVLHDNPDMEGMKPILAISLATAGRVDEARQQLTERALKMAKADHDMAYWTASTYALLGEKENALDWLESAIRLGNENKGWFEHDKNLNSLRNEPRYIELMQKITDNH
jgi:serine/threonine-protein kinase